ncbi:MAG TPA: TIM barrel protein, partial [bacterium]|nr:TIM barrel protein [bacterium]
FSAVEFFNRYSNNIRHFHLHDNDGTEDSHLAPGNGNIDFTQVLDIINKSTANTAIFELEIDRFEKSIYNIRNLFLGDRS